jgi:hypothetical protein
MSNPADKPPESAGGSSSAVRQAAYKARQEQAGKKRVQVWLDEGDWQVGFDAGEARKPSQPDESIRDQLAWFSGWIEGDAKRRGF